MKSARYNVVSKTHKKLYPINSFHCPRRPVAGSTGVTSVCQYALFPHDISKTDAAGITEMFHDES